MERYWGSLLPAIKNRCYPYASLDCHVLDKARLTHIKLLYGLDKELSLRPPLKENEHAITVSGCVSPYLI